MNVVHKFLDAYVGETFVLRGIGGNRFNTYYVMSNDGWMVMFFDVRSDRIVSEEIPKVKIYRNGELCGMVRNFFEIGILESSMHVEEWFMRKIGAKDYLDLLDFIPNELENTFV